MFNPNKIASTLDAGRGVFVDLDESGQPIRVVAEAQLPESIILSQVKQAGWRVSVGPFTRVATEGDVDYEGAEVLSMATASEQERDPLGYAIRAEQERAAQAESFRYGLDAHASASRGDRVAGKAHRAGVSADLAEARNTPNIRWSDALSALTAAEQADPSNLMLRNIIRAASAQNSDDFISFTGLSTFARTAAGSALNQAILDTLTDVGITAVRQSASPAAQKAHARAAALAPQCVTAAGYDRVVREYGLERDDFTRSLLRAYAQEMPSMDKDLPMDPMGSVDPAAMPDPMAPAPDAAAGSADPMGDEPVVVSVPDPHDESRMLEVSISAKDPVPDDADSIDEAAAAPLPSDATEEFEVKSSNGSMSMDRDDGSAKDTAERFKAASLEVAEARVMALAGAKRVSAGVLTNGETNFYIVSLGKQRNRTAKITKDDTLSRCAALGLTESAVTSAVLSGGGITVAGWRIAASADGTSVSFGRVGSTVPRVLALTALDTQVADFRRAAASDARGVYRVSVDVPGQSVAERRAAAKRIIADVSATLAPIGTAIDTAKGEVVLAYHGHPTKRDLARLAATVHDRFGLGVRGQYQPFVGPANPKPAAGQPAQPMTQPMQTVNTSSQNQAAMAAGAAMTPSQAAANTAQPMQPSSAGAPGLNPMANPLQAPKTAADATKDLTSGKKSMCSAEGCTKVFSGAKCPKCGAARKAEKKAQAMPPEPMPGESVLGDDPMGAPGGMPGEDPMMGMPPAGPQASPMATPSGNSPISPEDMKLIDAGVLHYRTTGLLPLAACVAFLKEYDAILDKFGPSNATAQEASLPRQQAEIEIIQKVLDAFKQPAVQMADPVGAGPGMGAAPAPL